jgi:hypothetical protein
MKKGASIDAEIGRLIALLSERHVSHLFKNTPNLKINKKDSPIELPH